MAAEREEHPRIGRRRFLKLCGTATLAGLTGMVGYRVLAPGHRQQPTPTGRASASFDEESSLEAFSNIRHEENLQIVSDPENEGQVLQVAIPQGNHYGVSMDYRVDSEPDELWAQYALYIPEDISFNTNGKLPGFAGGDAGYGGRMPDGENGWTARGRFAEGNQSGTVNVGYYVYDMNTSGRIGDPYEWDVNLELGRWHTIRQHIILNTPGEQDGVLEGWVNGDNVFEQDGFEFRSTNDLAIDRYWFDIYWGGDPTAPQDTEFFFNDLHVSRDEPSDQTGDNGQESGGWRSLC